MQFITFMLKFCNCKAAGLLQWHEKNLNGNKRETTTTTNQFNKKPSTILCIWASMAQPVDPLLLLNVGCFFVCLFFVLFFLFVCLFFCLILLLRLPKHCHFYLWTADTCSLRTGQRPAGIAILVQIKLHMFKGLHELANKSSQYHLWILIMGSIYSRAIGRRHDNIPHCGKKTEAEIRNW